MPALEAVASPCIDVCRLNDRAVCIGCGRDLSEIADWADATEARKREIVQAARARLAGIKASLEDERTK